MIKVKKDSLFQVEMTGKFDVDSTLIKKMNQEIELAYKSLNTSMLKDKQFSFIMERELETKKLFMSEYGEYIYKKATDGNKNNLPLESLVDRVLRQHSFLVNPEIETDSSFCEFRIKERHDKMAAVILWGILRSKKSGEQLIENMLKPSEEAYQLLPHFEKVRHLDLETVSISLINNAGYITFKNSNSLNAEDNSLVRDMETAVDLISLSKEAKVGILRGGKVNNSKYKGQRVFSAGINLKHFRQGKISFINFLVSRELGYVNKIVRGIRVPSEFSSNIFLEIDTPWLSVVDNFAIGGGMQLLLASDYVLGETYSYASLPAAKEGIVPGLANLRLGPLSNERFAKQVILHGKIIHANSDDGKLIFDSLESSEDIDEKLIDIVKMLAQPAVAINKKMMRIAREPLELYREYISEFILRQAERLYASDVEKSPGEQGA